MQDTQVQFLGWGDPLENGNGSVQFSCLVMSDFCYLMDCSTPGFPVHHQLLELAQTHANQVADSTQPSQPLLSSSPLAFNLSQHQGLFQ